MAKRRQVILLLLLLLLLLTLLVFSSSAAQNATTSPAEEFHVGVILDLGSLVGKVALTSVSLAVEDFYAACWNCSRKLVLHIRDSMGNDVHAASAGTLLDNTLAPLVGYPSTAYFPGGACGGISVLGASGHGVFFPGTWVAV